MNELIARAKVLLEEHFATNIEFGEPETLDSQFTVLRVPISANNLPNSIIIKQLPDKARFGGLNRLLAEYVALEFLQSLAGEFAARPLLLDNESLMLISEDLGLVPSLLDVLNGANPELASEKLIQYGHFLGQLQAASFGHEDDFRAIQQRLGSVTPPNDSSLDLRLRKDLSQSLISAKCADETLLTAEIWRISETMHDDSPFRVFTHHDAGPHNILLTERGIRFVDWEFSRYEHALLDMTAVRLAFPPFGGGQRIPQDVLLAYENAYRESASTAIPALLDEKLYAEHLELACAKWLLTKIIGNGEIFYPLIVCNDLSYAPEKLSPDSLTYHRRMIYTWLWTYLESFPSKQALPESYRFLDKIAADMRQFNPGLEPFDYFQAFH